MKWNPRKNKHLLGSSWRSASSAGPYIVDESSGQVYTEQTISAVRNEERDWSRPSRTYRKPTDSITKPLKGTRSLQDTCVETLVENFMDLDFEGMDLVPEKPVLRVWNLISER